MGESFLRIMIPKDLFGWTNSSIFSKYPSLLGTMESTHDNQGGQWRYGELLERLCNVETLFMLAVILLIIEKMRNIMKKIEQRFVYIV